MLRTRLVPVYRILVVDRVSLTQPVGGILHRLGEPRQRGEHRQEREQADERTEAPSSPRAGRRSHRETLSRTAIQVNVRPRVSVV